LSEFNLRRALWTLGFRKNFKAVLEVKIFESVGLLLVDVDGMKTTFATLSPGNLKRKRK